MPLLLDTILTISKADLFTNNIAFFACILFFSFLPAVAFPTGVLTHPRTDFSWPYAQASLLPYLFNLCCYLLLLFFLRGEHCKDGVPYTSIAWGSSPDPSYKTGLVVSGSLSLLPSLLSVARSSSNTRAFSFLPCDSRVSACPLQCLPLRRLSTMGPIFLSLSLPFSSSPRTLQIKM